VVLNLLFYQSMTHTENSMETPGITSALLTALNREKAINLDVLPQRLPNYTWNQIFVAVDTLTREGVLRLDRADRLTYEVSLSVPDHQAA
jgi:hypothetical protein